MAYDLYLGRQIKIKQLNLNITNESLKSAQQDLNNLAQQRQATYLETQQLKEDQCELKKDISFLTDTSDKLRQNVEQQEIYNNEYKAKRSIEIEEELAEYNRQLQQDANQSLILMQKEFTEEFKKENQEKLIAAQRLVAKLESLQSAVNAAVELNKKQQEQEDYNDYHRLQLSEQDILDIHKLYEVSLELSPQARTAINKVIWKIYYEKPYSDLIGRVIGNTPKMGIYKLTNMNNQMCYVGQAVNIGDRWKTHIKCAIGAEEHSDNKLYNAMSGCGPWKFTFEIIEECTRDKLNQKEDYWQNFYHAKDYGYSIK